MDLVAGVAGVLLTGGASRRMGRDKASIVFDGEPLAVRAARVLRSALAGPLVEVGPGVSGLPALMEEVPGEGPLAAIGAAAAVLDCSHPMFVLAVDMPAMTRELVRLIAGHPSSGSVVPVDAGGRRQPLCARWSPAAISEVPRLLAAGRRAVHEAIDGDAVTLLQPAEWAAVAPPGALADVDTPADLESAIGAPAAEGTVQA